MKILTLNTWGGRAGKDNLRDFFRSHTDVDVFCLQEIWSAPYEHLEGVKAGGMEMKHEDIMVHAKQEISEILIDHNYFFHPHFMENYGLMMLVKKSIEVVGSGDVFVHKQKGYIPEGTDIGHHARNIQYVTFLLNDVKCTVINFHGLWNGKGKGDSEDRLEQSRKIVNFIQGLEGKVILCGDFNLLPDTESIRILENAGLRNLVTEYGITSTRTNFYTKPEKFADYIFINNTVKLKHFEVLKDEVSDHAPLFIEIK